MRGAVVLEVHLLAQMRASDLVEDAYRRLGLTSDLLARCRDEASRLRLAEPGHPLGTYANLLGPPLAEERATDPDPYRRRALSFRLQLWPEFTLVVRGSESGQTAGLAFASVAAAPRVAILSSAVPWHLVDEQIAGWPGTRVVDEWYPMKDYRVVLRNDDGNDGEYVLQFDYGLLQAVAALPRIGASGSGG